MLIVFIYSKEDNSIWQILCKRQTIACNKNASKQVYQGLKDIEFNPKKVPNFQRINKILLMKTGWQIVPVNGFIPNNQFFNLISQRKFPCTIWIRTRKQLDYLQEPDLFHDVFGHCPLLTNKPFCDFMEKVGLLATKHQGSKEIIEKLSRLWWFTVEFGLIKENDKLKIYGGGILSSYSEVSHSLSNKVKHLNFDVKKIMRTPYYIDRLQSKLFVIDSFEQLFNSIKEVQF